MNYQAPLARARGLGSAREGWHHWWSQRTTAVALLPLSLWFAFSVTALPDASYQDVVSWISSPWNSILLISFIAMVFFHAILGMQTILEDYIHSDWLRMLGILSIKMLLALLALGSAFSVLRVVLVG